MNGKWLQCVFAVYLAAMAGSCLATEWVFESAMNTASINLITGDISRSSIGTGPFVANDDVLVDTDQVVLNISGSGGVSAINNISFCGVENSVSINDVSTGLTINSVIQKFDVPREENLTITNSKVRILNDLKINKESYSMGILTITNSCLSRAAGYSAANFGVSEIKITLGTNNLADGGDYALKFENSGSGDFSQVNFKITTIAVDGDGEKYKLVYDAKKAADATVASNLTSKLTTALNTYKVTAGDTAKDEDANGYYVVKTAKGGDDPSGDPSDVKKIALAASTANGGLADALLQINADTANPEMRALLNSLETCERAGGKAALGRAITELNGANAAVNDVRITQSATQEFNNALGNVFADRLSRTIYNDGGSRLVPAGRVSASAGGVPVTYQNFGATAAACAQYTGWFKVYGGFGGVDGTRAAAGYDFGGVGVMTGIERQFGSELSLGALLGWSFNRSKIAQDMGDATDNILRLGVYGDYQWNGFQFSTTPTLGIHMLENERNIHFLNMTAQNERTGVDFNWLNQIAYAYEFCNGLTLTPSYSLAMTYLHDPAHTEHGAGAANLHIRDCDNWSLTQNLGLKVGKVFQINDCLSLLPEIWGGWEHEYLSTNDVTMNFAAAAGNAWSAPVEDIAANRAVFGAGVKTMIGERWQIDARYDQKIWDGGYNTNFSLGASFKF